MAGRNRSLGQSERARLDPFQALGESVPPRDQRDLMERPFFSLAKAKRIEPILYKSGNTEVEVHAVPEHGLATIWDADVLIWAASQLLAAQDRGLAISRFIRFTPYQLLTAIGRGTGARNYRLLKGGLARLQSTVVRTTIRNSQHWRRQQFSWLNEWEELQTRSGRIEGMEFVLPDWFYKGVLDRRLVLAIDPGYFRLTGGIERWLYRVARKHAGRQPNGWRFELRHLHIKSGCQVRFSDFAVHIRGIVRRQSLPDYSLELDARNGADAILIMRPRMIELFPRRVDKLSTAARSIGTSDARRIGTSAVVQTVLRTHGSQASLWPETEIFGSKDSKSESKLIVEARAAGDEPGSRNGRGDR